MYPNNVLSEMPTLCIYYISTDTYFIMLRTGIRIDDPGSRTLSSTSKSGSFRGIDIEFDIFAVLFTFWRI